MYVVIGGATYTEITDLQFNPEADLTGDTVPVNELWVNVKTDDAIQVGERISLFDDADNIWAKYWVTYAEKESYGFKKVHGQSALFKLDQTQLEPVMYENETVGNAIVDVLATLGSEYEVDETLAAKTLDGFCPKQSARVRLQWICMATGAYVREFFTDRIQLVPYGNVLETFVDASRVYWKPTVSHSDYVTKVVGTYYNYVNRNPYDRTESYVEADGRIYVQYEDTLTLPNDDVPEIALENVLEISGMTLLNENNVDAVLSRLALYNFERTTVSMEIVDNGDVMPGQAIVTYSDENELVTGFVKSASFTFGTRAKASIELVGCKAIDGGWLTVQYVWEDMVVGEKRFYLPLGMPFETSNPYLQLVTRDDHRYVLRPVNDTTSGTLTRHDMVVREPMATALEYFEGSLMITSVDEIGVNERKYPDGDLVAMT